MASTRKLYLHNSPPTPRSHHILCMRFPYAFHKCIHPKRATLPDLMDRDCERKRYYCDGIYRRCCYKPIAARRTGPGLQHNRQKKLTTPFYSGIMLVCVFARFKQRLSLTSFAGDESGLALFNVKWRASRWLLASLKILTFAFQSSSFLNLLAFFSFF